MKQLLSIATFFAVLGCGDLNVNGDPAVSVNTQGAKVEPAPATPKAGPAAAPVKAPLQAAESKWTAEEFTRNMPACSKQAMESTQRNWTLPMDAKEADKFCVCHINAISKAYDFPTYEKNHTEISNQTGMIAQTQACVDEVTLARVQTEAALCGFGKICKGMTKEQVLKVLGQPTTIDNRSTGDTWRYTEDPTVSQNCANPYGGSYTYLVCSVTFNKIDILVGQDQINPEKLDLSKW